MAHYKLPRRPWIGQNRQVKSAKGNLQTSNETRDIFKPKSRSACCDVTTFLRSKGGFLLFTNDSNDKRSKTKKSLRLSQLREQFLHTYSKKFMYEPFCIIFPLLSSENFKYASFLSAIWSKKRFTNSLFDIDEEKRVPLANQLTRK